MWPKPPMSSPIWVAELVEIAGGEFVPARLGRQVTAEEVRQAAGSGDPAGANCDALSLRLPAGQGADEGSQPGGRSPDCL